MLVRQAMAKLPSRDAEILLLKYTENWSCRDLANHLDQTEAAIESGVARPVMVAPGRCVRMVPPGEKPSRVANGPFSMRFPCAERGSVVAPNATCTPVGMVGSGTVHTLDG